MPSEPPDKPSPAVPAEWVAQLEEMQRQMAELSRIVAAQSKLLESRLPSRYEQGTVTSTEMTSADFQKLPGEQQRRLGIAKAHGSRHPFPRAVYAAGSTVTDWAKEHKLDRNLVKAWFAKGKAVRPIPRRLAEEIAKQYPSVPATPEIWRGGFKD